MNRLGAGTPSRPHQPSALNGKPLGSHDYHRWRFPQRSTQIHRLSPMCTTLHCPEQRALDLGGDKINLDIRHRDVDGGSL